MQPVGVELGFVRRLRDVERPLAPPSAFLVLQGEETRQSAGRHASEGAPSTKLGVRRRPDDAVGRSLPAAEGTRLPLRLNPLLEEVEVCAGLQPARGNDVVVEAASGAGRGTR